MGNTELIHTVDIAHYINFAFDIKFQEKIKADVLAIVSDVEIINLFIAQCIVKSPTSDPIPLSHISTTYVEWHNLNVRQREQSIIEVQAYFENSVIATSLQDHPSGHRFLFNHRLINRYDNLHEGESYIMDAKDAVILPVDDINDVDNKTKDWIRENPPRKDEQTSAYHTRYKLDIGDTGVFIKKFNKVVKDEGYTHKKTKNFRCWTR